MHIKDKIDWDAKRLVPPVVLAALALAYMVIANGFSESTSAEAPLLYGGALLFLSVIVFALALVPGLKAAPKRSRTKRLEGPFPWKASVQIYTLIAGFIALVFLMGFFVAIPLFLFCFLSWISRLSILSAAVIAALAYGFTWFVFSYFLHLEVFTGYLAGYV